MAQNQNPRIAPSSVPPEALAAILSSSADPGNPGVSDLVRLLTQRMAREEKIVQDEEETQRNMRRQNAEAMEAKRQQDIAFQARCDHMTEHRDRAAIVGQRAHSGKYLLLCSKCSKLWQDVNDVEPSLQNRIKWEWIGGPQ